MDPLLELDGVTHEYATRSQKVIALNDISLRVMPKDYTAITGPSGSGKSTLVSLIAGLFPPTRGTIRYHGKSGDRMGWVAADFRKQMGFVFQNFVLINYQSVLENVISPLLYSDVPFWKHRAIGRDILGQMGIADKAKVYPHQLSGGQMQRVAIARALVRQPKIIVADEPTGNLDEGTADSILSIFDALHDQQGITLLIVTHSKQVIERCSTGVHLHQGRLVDQPQESLP